MMNNYKVTFSMIREEGKISFEKLEGISNEKLRNKLNDQLTSWEYSLREAALIHYLTQEVGKEEAQKFKVTFVHKTPK
ncbi:hypothetical protein [Guptibacillus hwajinpoensis]|uniref:Uncharacterized protein n=1 Tax=Guptibacillus hwajinpoensis TaxID=208199 RepID=A0A0J6CL35_9BACL|nr:hypothetical protein [Alkalihalobacillus macyae]KMM36946.1 hypothetical protein AB986_13630 [Alkalihalobacillus macyae]